MSKSLYNSLRQELRRHADKKQAEKDQYYHKYPGYKSYGIRAPKLDAILKNYRKEFRGLKSAEVFALTEKLYSSRIEEQILTGNYILAMHVELITPKRFLWLDKMLDYFGSWSTIDDFCIDVLQSVLLKYPEKTTNLLRKWNKSQNMWKRRASVVAFVRKVGESGKFVDVVIKLCENLLQDDEDLVQKGVGWALKDNMRGNKKKVMDYVKDLRRKGVSSTIILYAIRDLKGKERTMILDIIPVG